MMMRAVGTVSAIVEERVGVQEIRVGILMPDVSDEVVRQAVNYPDRSEAVIRRAVNYPDLSGSVVVGDRVLLNTVAVEMSLGTGGDDFVIAILNRDADVPTPAGHVMKLRYTPFQTPVLCIEAPESPHHQRIQEFESLNGIPVVCAGLHSQLPAICAGCHWAARQQHRTSPRIAYIMTDGAALPLALSRMAPQLKNAGLITATITAGQAFGGDYEAVNVYSALAAAYQIVKPDIIVISQGPGSVGTDTPLGFSGVDQGTAINAVASLDGTSIAALRIGFADPRVRHQGLSHHTLTCLKTIVRAPVLLPIPCLPTLQRDRIRQDLEMNGLDEEHEVITIDASRALSELERSGLKISTMGRSIAEDRPFFLAATAAGILAAQLIDGPAS